MSALMDNSRDSDVTEAVQNCDHCLKEYRNVAETSFCGVCLEYLCINCTKSHREKKATRGHKLYVGSDIPNNAKALQMIAGIVACPEHTEKEVELFCRDHDEYVCVECAGKAHRRCNNLTHVSGLLQPEHDRAFLEEARDKIKSLKELIAVEREKINEDIELIQEELADVREGRECLAKILYDLLIQHPDVSEEMVANVVSENIACFEQRLEELEDFENDQSITFNLVDATIQYGTKKQMHLVGFYVKMHFISAFSKAKDVINSEFLNELEVPRSDLDDRNQDDGDDEETLQSTHEESPDTDTNIHIERIANIGLDTLMDKPTDGEMSTARLVNEVDGNVANTTDDVHTGLDHTFVKKKQEGAGIQSGGAESNVTGEVINKTDAVVSIVDEPLISDKKQCVKNVSEQSAETSESLNRSFMKSNIKFVGKYKVSDGGDTYPCAIFGIAVLPDGCIVLIDQSNDKVKVFDDELEFISTTKLNFSPIDICHVQNDIVAVAGDKAIETLFVDGCILGSRRRFDTALPCYSISKHNNNLAVLFVDDAHFEVQIRQIDNGAILKRIHTFRDKQMAVIKMNPVSMRYSETHGLLLADEDHLRCFGADETQVWYYRGRRYTTATQFVCGLAEDSEGNVYACDLDTCTVHQISGKHFMKNRIILTDVPDPLAVAFQERMNRVIVGCHEHDYLYVCEFA